MFKEFWLNWREGWQFFGNSLKLIRKVFNRYWLVLMINMFIFIWIMNWIRSMDDRVIVLLPAVLLAYALSPLTFLLWLPHYLKQKKPHLYRGFIRTAGEWVGTPYPWKNNHYK